MSKLRIFVSSTYYDLKHIRNSIEQFIEDMGYEPILFESGDIPFLQDQSLDISCYKAIEEAHMQILIIGGRYGSPEVDISETQKKKIKENKMYEYYNSITKQEFEVGLKKGIPIYFFVDRNVLAEYDTYKSNRSNDSIKYVHVDSINIFKLLDDIFNLRTGNYIRPFERFSDISMWLREQWAGLFANYLEDAKSKIELKNLNTGIQELGGITSALKEYTEALMRKIQVEDYQSIIDKEEKRIIEEKGHRLMQEGMIEHLKTTYKLRFESINLYEALRDNYNNLPAFLSKLGMKKADIVDFLNQYKEQAEKELIVFSDVYLRRESEKSMAK